MGRSAATLVSVLLMLILCVPIASLLAPSGVSLAAESGDFTYALIENGTEVEIVGYTGSQANVTIPDDIEGRPVTSIGDSTFKNCSFMTNVTIPSTVRSIGREAFARTGLVEVDIPDGVTSIGDLAFERCYYLSSIALGRNLTTIGTSAFQTCPCLKVLTIPENVSSIGSYAFLYCTSLNFFQVSESNYAYNSSVDGVLYSKDGSALVQFPIGRHVSMRVPDGVTSIGEGAFSTALYLKQVTFSKTVASIGGYAFAHCPELYGMWFEGDAPTCGEGWADGHNSTLTVYYGPEAEGFTTPTWNDVASATSSEAMEFPYEIINNGTEVRLTEYNGPGGEVMIPSVIEGLPVTEIGDYAFSNAYQVTTLFVPASVRSIGVRALACGYTLGSIEVDDRSMNFTSVDGVLYDKGSVHLVQCPMGLSGSLIVPEGVTHIDPGALGSCYLLNEVLLPEGLVSIGDYAFEGCSIFSLSVPDSVEAIGNGAFRGCYNLANVNWSGNITSIPAETFSDCVSLVSFDVPENVSFIGWHAFAYSNLERVSIPYEGVVLDIGAFEFCWLLREVSMAPRIIGPNAFYYCESLTDLDLREYDGIESIGDQAFMFCRSLTNFTWPNGVALGWGVFGYCSALQEIAIPEAEAIPDYAFFECTTLRSVTLPNNCTSIGTDAFQRCYSLEAVVIPGNVSYIGFAAFSGCTNLTGIYFEGDAPNCDPTWVEGANGSLVIYHREGAAGFNTTVWENMTVEIWVEDEATNEGIDALLILTIVAIVALAITAVVFLAMRRRK